MATPPGGGRSCADADDESKAPTDDSAPGVVEKAAEQPDQEQEVRRRDRPPYGTTPIPGSRRVRNFDDPREQCFGIFDYFDTDRDGLLDAKTASHVMRLLGFGPVDFSEYEAVSFPKLFATAEAIEKGLNAEGRARRTFNLIKAERFRERTVHWKEFHAFLTEKLGMDVSEDHAERLTEIISKNGDDYFGEDELVDYLLKYEQLLKEHTAAHGGDAASMPPMRIF